jgi:hypothetical protein
VGERAFEIAFAGMRRIDGRSALKSKSSGDLEVFMFSKVDGQGVRTDGFDRHTIPVMSTRTPVPITSQDYWFKIVDMLQQNWALVDPAPDGIGVVVYFVDDRSRVFDRLTFPDVSEAQQALRRNEFQPLAEDPEAQTFLAPPLPPFFEGRHPNGPIYSSGMFWT